MPAGAEAAGGAYGLAFPGVDPRHAVLQPAPAHWPPVEVTTRVGTAPAVSVAAAPLRAHFTLSAGTADSGLAHPLLSTAAATLARMLGREAVHAGVILGPAGAWAVCGERESGKSTTLAALALLGLGVASDDLLVVDQAGPTVFRGPRCLDLRPQSAAWLGAEGRCTPVRGGTRLRLGLADMVAEAPVAGVVFLEWGAETVERLGPAERLRRLAAQRVGQEEPGGGDGALALAALPAFLVRRPRGAESLRWTAEAVAEVAGYAPVSSVFAATEPSGVTAGGS